MQVLNEWMGKVAVWSHLTCLMGFAPMQGGLLHLRVLLYLDGTVLGREPSKVAGVV